jgi:hypothetical protein
LVVTGVGVGSARVARPEASSKEKWRQLFQQSIRVLSGAEAVVVVAAAVLAAGAGSAQEEVKPKRMMEVTTVVRLHQGLVQAGVDSQEEEGEGVWHNQITPISNQQRD